MAQIPIVLGIKAIRGGTLEFQVHSDSDPKDPQFGGHPPWRRLVRNTGSEDGGIRAATVDHIPMIQRQLGQ